MELFGIIFLLTFCLCLLHSGFAVTISATYQGGNETDHQALLAFKSKVTHDPHQIMSSWNDSVHFCDWRGVTCSQQHQGRVTMLDLQSKQLGGSLPPSIGNLSFLEVLDLRRNHFSLQIPDQIGQLRRLQLLDLDGNSFEGAIPTNISHCSGLTYLSLRENKLSGEIPLELSYLPVLEVIQLDHNFLSGHIPPSLGNLSSLQTLSTPFNRLEGNIPESIGQLTSLSYFAVCRNKLSSTIPSSIYNLSSLTLLSAPGNQIHGTLPPDLGLTLPKLELLNLHTNNLTGQLPVTLANATNLRHIIMGTNQFTGKVPSLARLHKLIALALHHNRLGNGEYDDSVFLSSLANCTNLEVLTLNDNSFRATLPQSLSSFSTKLRTLQLGRNKLEGTIPIGIGSLVSLEALGMESNQLTGSIPFSIGDLQMLSELFLNDNFLSGTIPSSLGNLGLLGVLNFTSNNLEGRIPSSLGQCRNLLMMSISQNNLSGIIPKLATTLSYVDLSCNHLTGSLPAEVGKLTRLSHLDVSNNQLSGEIPSSLGSCTSLVRLYMEVNFFQGAIPQSLASFRDVKFLDLSQNNLSGQIPAYLETFSHLQYLNLSYNDLEGEVPTRGVFRLTSAVPITGNMKLCGGMPQLKLPMCTAEEARSKRLHFVLRVVIPIFCALLGLILAATIWCQLRKKKVDSPNTNPSFDGWLVKLSYERLLRATDGFSSENLIGEGNFGSVYAGVLEDEDEALVAVKVLNLQHVGASKSFIAECEALRNIRHRNLVRTLTACSSIDFQGKDFKALVFEFMVNGSLEEWLHPVPSVSPGHGDTTNLNLLQRLNIAIDVACALDYLHHGCHPPIVHCDLKPSNVLLDGDMTACVSDFGLARFLPVTPHTCSANQSSSLGLKGSIGYVAPEYGMGSKVSTYGDVYSYGILLLEMFTGKRPTDGMFKDGLNLHKYAEMAFPERVEEIVDPIIVVQEEKGGYMRDKSLECLVCVVGIGIACCAESLKDRMDISKVRAELNKIRDVYAGTEKLEKHQIAIKFVS